MLQYLSLFVAYVMFIYSVYIQLLFVCYNYSGMLFTPKATAANKNGS